MSTGRRLMIGTPEAAEELMRIYASKEQQPAPEFREPAPQTLPAFSRSPEAWPRCPLPSCGAALWIVDQNQVGDFAFECMGGGMAAGHDYKAIYRVASASYEPRPLFDGEGRQVPIAKVAEMTGWIQPRVAEPKKPAAPAPPAPEPAAEATLLRAPVLTPLAIAKLFKGGASMADIAAEHGITAQEVEASIRVAALVEGESAPAQPAKGAAPKPRRRRRRAAPKPAAPSPPEPA